MVYITIEFIVFVLAVYGIMSQIIVPAIMGRLLFPAFRKEGTIVHEIAVVEQQLHEKELDAVLQQKKADLTPPPTEPPQGN